MPAHGRSKNGVAEPVIGTRDFRAVPLARLCAGIHVLNSVNQKTRMAGTTSLIKTRFALSPATTNPIRHSRPGEVAGESRRFL
jgi:hypothetical protein